MDVRNLLNAKLPVQVPNHTGLQHPMQAQPAQQYTRTTHHHYDQPTPQSYVDARVKPEAGPETVGSYYTNMMQSGVSEHASRYPAYSTTPRQAFQQTHRNLPGALRYPSPTRMQGSVQMFPEAYTHGSISGNHYGQEMLRDESSIAAVPLHDSNAIPTQMQIKAFACSVCRKGFARRSDLARHERIHSGDRPHFCDFPNCGKQFIQRSALTVHARVHTGEKPHTCEHCGKPFSDSSSLARHRRIHSGQRPYKCPYADCQKTFTRRTTLTRHQNHHTGTVQESAAARDRALASGASTSSLGPQEDMETQIEQNAQLAPDATDEESRLSQQGMIHGRNTHSQQSDYFYEGPETVPPRRSGNVRSVSASSNMYASQHATALASQSNGYGPPAVLEPNGLSVTESGSPHAPGSQWHSLEHGLPRRQSGENFSYPEPNHNLQGQNLYYPASDDRPPKSSNRRTYDAQHRPPNDARAQPVH